MREFTNDAKESLIIQTVMLVFAVVLFVLLYMIQSTIVLKFLPFFLVVFIMALSFICYQYYRYRNSNLFRLEKATKIIIKNNIEHDYIEQKDNGIYVVKGEKRIKIV